jgi:hypothetical protein
MKHRRWLSIDYFSMTQVVCIAAVIALGVFVIGQRTLDAWGMNPCDAQCGYEPCWNGGVPQGTNCGTCAEYIMWDNFYEAGPNCVTCAEGMCIAEIKIDIDHCGVCDVSYVRQCLTCIS